MKIREHPPEKAPRRSRRYGELYRAIENGILGGLAVSAEFPSERAAANAHQAVSHWLRRGDGKKLGVVTMRRGLTVWITPEEEE